MHSVDLGPYVAAASEAGAFWFAAVVAAATHSIQQLLSRTFSTGLSDLYDLKVPGDPGARSIGEVVSIVDPELQDVRLLRLLNRDHDAVTLFSSSLSLIVGVIALNGSREIGSLLGIALISIALLVPVVSVTKLTSLSADQYFDRWGRSRFKNVSVFCIMAYILVGLLYTSSILWL